ncbi:hypothetical protein LTS16_026929 [Friedmanniomyces endolithicus]|nr:hypothetical protein LTS16_026929 [Friedmanniomyces endolithicus]
MAEHEDQGRLADIEEDRGNGTAQTITIDPSGDICLAVESGNTSKELQVSSKILSAASSVFQTMFTPNFWEGLAAEDLLPIGAICDKCDFIEALRLWSSSSLRAAIVEADDNGMYTLLEAAYLLDSWEEFGQVSTQIISHHVGAFKHSSINTFGDGHLGRKSARAHEKSMDDLEAKREDAIFAAVVALEKVVADLFRIGRVSDWHPGGRWVRQLEDNGMWPMGTAIQQRSLWDVLEWMQIFTDPWHEITRDDSHLCNEPGLMMREKLREIRGDILNTKFGLCLDCVNTEGESYRTSKCRSEFHKAGTKGNV